jgi:hypothetical protein
MSINAVQLRDGQKSTDFGRAVLAAAVRTVDPIAADAIASESKWRVSMDRAVLMHMQYVLNHDLVVTTTAWCACGGTPFNACMHSRRHRCAEHGHCTAQHC